MYLLWNLRNISNHKETMKTLAQIQIEQHDLLTGWVRQSLWRPPREFRAPLFRNSGSGRRRVWPAFSLTTKNIRSRWTRPRTKDSPCHFAGVREVGRCTCLCVTIMKRANVAKSFRDNNDWAAVKKPVQLLVGTQPLSKVHPLPPSHAGEVFVSLSLYIYNMCMFVYLCIYLFHPPELVVWSITYLDVGALYQAFFSHGALSPPAPVPGRRGSPFAFTVCPSVILTAFSLNKTV